MVLFLIYFGLMAKMTYGGTLIIYYPSFRMRSCHKCLYFMFGKQSRHDSLSGLLGAVGDSVDEQMLIIFLAAQTIRQLLHVYRTGFGISLIKTIQRGACVQGTVCKLLN